MQYRSALHTFCLPWATLMLSFLLSASCPAIQSQSGGQSPASKTTTQRKTAAQTGKTAPRKTISSDTDWMEEALHNPKLMAEVSQLVQKLRDGIQVPGARNQSRIMPRLDDSTVFYLALPNYGDTVHQSLQIFQEQLKVSPELRAFLHKHQLEEVETSFESGLQKLYELSQFLGDEIVVTGKLHGKEPTGILVAEIKKPGLHDFLEKINAEMITSKSDRMRILDPQQLSVAAAEKDGGQGPVVLLRPDLLVLGFSVSGLQEFESQIGPDSPRFTSTDLGQRLELAYQQGTSVLFGADLHRLIGLIPQRTAQDRQFMERSGIKDVDYLALSSSSSGGRATNIGEVTFNSPRRGVVSWIATPAPMGALDFIPENAGSVGDVVLKSPAQIYDELREMLGESAFQSVTQMETQMGVNLKRDLLSKLTGEIAFETPTPAMPPATASSSHGMTAQKPGPFVFILGVSDPDVLQQTLTRLLAAAPFEAGTREEQGVTIHTLKSPGSDQAMEINYFFLQNYLVVGTDKEAANSALRAHIQGRSLAKSSKLLDTLESTQIPSASIMFYQDASQMLSAIFSQLPAEIRNILPKPEDINAKPTIVSVSADARAFRGATNSNVQAEISMGLVAAAMVIPNLLRSRTAANESAATAGLRTLNTAQVTYVTAYPKQGYAASLAALGPGPTNCSEDTSATPAHACLLDATLGGPTCTSGKWCEKSGYKFSIRAICPQSVCKDYVATATPADSVKSGKSFCTTTDGVIRSHTGPQLMTPVTVAECTTWTPLK